VLRDNPEMLAQLDPCEISQAIVMAMITNPGDGKPDNCIFYSSNCIHTFDYANILWSTYQMRQIVMCHNIDLCALTTTTPLYLRYNVLLLHYVWIFSYVIKVVRSTSNPLTAITNKLGLNVVVQVHFFSLCKPYVYTYSQVVCVLFCMDHMKAPVHPYVRDLILNIDIAKGNSFWKVLILIYIYGSSREVA
jgi:hypothetical protein